MNHLEIANRTGVSFADLDELLKGRATANVASRLGVTMGDVEAFIDGKADLAMTQRLGLQTMSAAMELGAAAGQAGAIGIIMGLLLSN